MSLIARRCAIWFLAVSVPALGESMGGTWVAEGLGEVTFKVTGTRVSGRATGEALEGIFFDATMGKGGRATGRYRAADGQAMPFAAQVGPEGLWISFGGQPPIGLVRAGASTAPSPVPVLEAMGAPDPGGNLPQATALKAAPATGPVHRVDDQGWQLHAPAAWKVGQHSGRTIVVSDTEAGLIVVWFTPGVRYEQIVEHASDGYTDQNVSLRPASTPVTARLKGGRAVAIDLTGMAMDGSDLRARAVGIEGPNGALGLVGITSPQKISMLRTRVDAVAASVGFFKPKPAPVMRELVGGWWHWSGSTNSSSTYFGSISRERKLALCPGAIFFDSSSTDIYSTTKSSPYDTDAPQTTAGYDSQRGGDGRWSASGGPAGVLRLTYPNGNVREMQYRFTTPNDIELDGTWFGRDPKVFASCQ